MTSELFAVFSKNTKTFMIRIIATVEPKFLLPLDPSIVPFVTAMVHLCLFGMPSGGMFRDLVAARGTLVSRNTHGVAVT